MVMCKDELGTVRPAVVTRVNDPITGDVNVVEFGVLEGEEPAVQRCGYRFSASGAGHRVWYWPPKV
jgi:hypothetical protein